MRTLRTIEVPWTPYALMFSRDGTRLAIGGGSSDGPGGVAIVELATGDVRLIQIAERRAPDFIAAVSGLWFAPDDRYLLASTWSFDGGWGPTLVLEVQGSDLVRRAQFG